MPPTLAQLLHSSIERDPARPLVTYYDRTSGERTELSGTTFGNWVAKTANLLRDDFDVHESSTVALALPMHWQQLVLAFGTWTVGGCVTESPRESPDVLIMSPSRLMELSDASAGDLLVASLDPMGRAYAPRPDHVLDYTTEVRVHGDHFSPAPIEPTAPAYAGGSLVLDHAHAATTVTELAHRLDITPRSRVLVTVGAAGEAGLLTWAAPALLGGGSLVLVRGTDEATDGAWMDHIADQEGVTMRLGEGGTAG